MKPAVERVVAALRAHGLDPRIVEFAESTRTAEDAARTVGTSVGQIVKSLVFVAAGEPVLALVSGANRVDTDRLGALLGAEISRANAALVRSATSFAIGGVPPIGHTTALPVLMDADLLQYQIVYAAAGTPNDVFAIDPATLAAITGARVEILKME